MANAENTENTEDIEDAENTENTENISKVLHDQDCMFLQENRETGLMRLYRRLPSSPSSPALV
jgi:hypothetical protein